MKLNDHKKVLDQLAELLEQEKGCVAQIYTDPERVKSQNELLEIAQKKKDEDFFVLVIGAFSSGKSSMINAMIGKELLPTGFLPETAVIGELHYGLTERIILYPKKGRWEGGDEPFELDNVSTEEIEKYVSLTSDDAVNAMEQTATGDASKNKIDAKFEKMIIYWPLEILKDGVVLVDSPGINDPYSNDHIVNEFLPHADAVIYVMDSQHPYQGTDKTQLTAINSIGRRDIMTGYTFYDIVQQVESRPAKLEQLRSRLISYMAGHSDLGQEAVHFLNSKGGLRAKMKNDRTELRDSGFEGFEEYLTRYLVQNKGKTQVKNMAGTILQQAKTLQRDAAMFNRTAGEDATALKKKIGDARQQLAIVRSNSMNTGRIFRRSLENHLPAIRNMIHTFILDLPEQVDLEDFEPVTALPQGLRNLWPWGEGGAKSCAKAIQKECEDELNQRMQNVYRKWATETLTPYLKSTVKDSAQEISQNLEQIARDLAFVNELATGEVSKEEGNLGNIALGIAYGILTGDWFTGGMSAIYGARTMGRAVAYQIGAGVILGTLALAGATITLPVVVIAGIGASILSILLDNNDRKVERLKQKAVRDFRKQFTSQEAQKSVSKMENAVYESARQFIEEACLDMEAALAKDIKNTEDSLNQIISESESSSEAKKKQVEDRNKAGRTLDTICEKVHEICRDYNIKEIAAAN